MYQCYSLAEDIFSSNMMGVASLADSIDSILYLFIFYNHISLVMPTWVQPCDPICGCMIPRTHMHLELLTYIFINGGNN